MKLFHDYKAISFHAFWSGDTSKIFNDIMKENGKGYATQHDILLRFVNDRIFKGQGELNKEFRSKGKTYPDLLIPFQGEGQQHEVVELRTHTSELKYLRRELNKREKTFASSDYLYFTYFLRRVWKEKGKILKAHDCIYYIVIISIPKETEKIPINELVKEINMGAEDFTKKVAEKSGLDSEKEDLLGVDNIFKAVELERRLEERERFHKKEMENVIKENVKQLKEKESEVKEKDKQLKKKEKEIKQLKKQLDEIRK